MHKFFKFIFGIKLYMFRTVPLSIIKSFSLYTQLWYMSYSFADSCQKLVDLVGFIIRIYHNARSPERQLTGSCVDGECWLPCAVYK